MLNRALLKNAAKEQIRGKIGILFVITLIVFGIIFLASFIPFVGSVVVNFFLTPAFSLSLTRIYLKIADGKDVATGDVFDGFYKFWGAFKVTFLVGLFTMLWSLLFVVPGIIKAYSYSMALYIWAENPQMGALEAIKKSQEIMEGHKMDYFVLELSFIGWILLGAVTFGLAYIYVIPYVSATDANFYRLLCPAQSAEYVYTAPAEDIPAQEEENNAE